MRGDSGEREQIVEREIAVAHGIQAVGSDARKAELARDGSAVDSETIAGQGARAHGAGVGSFRGVLQPSQIARKSFRVREQKMREQNRLRMLHMRHAGHGHVKICLGLFEKSAQQLEEAGLNFLRGIHDEEAKIGSDQLVAAAASVQLPAERAEFMDQRTFHEVVDVFGGGAFEEGRIIA